MQNKPVNWSEGLFLRPHHLQAAERYFTERVTIGERWSCPYNYGIRAIKISTEAIANYQVEISACQARMQDGTLIDFDAGEAPTRVGTKEGFQGLQLATEDLEVAFSKEAVVKVYLAVPCLTLGRANVGKIGQTDHQRFLENPLPVPDECAGGNEQSVTFRDLNIKIALSTDDLSGYELLPVAQIKRSGDATSTPILDEHYFPPLLAIDGWPQLEVGIIRAIYDFLGQQQERISGEVIDRGIGLASQNPAEIDQIFRLMFVNEAYALLRCFAFSKGVHPFTVYSELCRIVARLGVLTKERRMPEAPQYDHDNLAPIFEWFLAQVQQVFYSPDELTYEHRFFMGYGKGMRVSLDPKWLLEDWEWYVGVARGEFSEKECRALLAQGSMNWKIGSAERVDFYFDMRAPGLHLDELEQAPHILPTQPGWVYYKVDQRTHEFNEVRQHQTLAIRFSEAHVQNKDDLLGKRDLVISYKDKTSTLRFALFAIKRK